MDNSLEKVTSSRLRLKIAHLVSTRPRTLRELASKTGISVQGVLKHLATLKKAGILEVRRISGAKHPFVRKVYSIRGAHVGDYSQGNLMVVNLVKSGNKGTPPAKGVYTELENLAEDILIQKRRIRDQARRLERILNELAASELRLKGDIEVLDLSDAEKLVAQVVFTEETLDDARTVISEHYGYSNPEEVIEGVMRKVRRFG